MTKKNDARIERLEKTHQDTQGQMTKMMEMLRTLVRDKGQATGLGKQSSAAHSDQKKRRARLSIGIYSSVRTNAAHASNGRIFVRLPASPDTVKRSRIELKGKYD